MKGQLVKRQEWQGIAPVINDLSNPLELIRKPRSRPYSALLELTQANWGQGFSKSTNFGWNRPEWVGVSWS